MEIRVLDLVSPRGHAVQLAGLNVSGSCSIYPIAVALLRHQTAHISPLALIKFYYSLHETNARTTKMQLNAKIINTAVQLVFSSIAKVCCRNCYV